MTALYRCSPTLNAFMRVTVKHQPSKAETGVKHHPEPCRASGESALSGITRIRTPVESG